MTMYKLTKDPSVVVRAEDSATIPRGHRWWNEYETWLAEGNTPEAATSSEPDVITQTKTAISLWLDSVVQERGYDNIVSCASYAASADATFRAEAQAAIAWRDAVYRRGYEILANPPEGVVTPDDVMAILPKPEEFGWPASDNPDTAAA